MIYVSDFLFRCIASPVEKGSVNKMIKWPEFSEFDSWFTITNFGKSLWLHNWIQRRINQRINLEYKIEFTVRNTEHIWHNFGFVLKQELIFSIKLRMYTVPNPVRYMYINLEKHTYILFKLVVYYKPYFSCSIKCTRRKN